MQITLADPATADNLPGTPLQQSGTYAAVMRSFGCETVMMDVTEGAAQVARARCYARRIGPLRIAWLPRGPVWGAGASTDQKTRALAALPRAAPWRALWAMGGDAGQPRRGLPVANGVQMAELDLTGDMAARRAAQHGKWRNRLARAETRSLSVKIRPLDLARDGDLLAQEARQRTQRRYAALPHHFTERWTDIAPQDSLILTAEEGGTPVAFMLMLLHAPTATYHIGWTNPRGRSLNAHTLLLWRASCHLAQADYTRLDLGQTDAARLPGITRFKTGTGAALRDLGATTLCL